MRLRSWTGMLGAVATFSTLLTLSPGPAAAAESTTRPRVAVIDFDAALSGRTLPPPDLGSAAAQVMIDRLVSSGDYQVFDGHWLARRTPNGGVPLDTIRESATAAGVDYLVVGSITRFSEEQRNRGFGGAGFRLPVIGGVAKQRAELVVSVLVKLIDVRSGEIVTTASGLGTSRRSKIGVLGLVPIAGGGYSRSSSNARDAQLDEAMQQSIELASRGLVAWRHR